MNEPGSAIRKGLLSRSAAIFAIRFFPVAAMLGVQIAFSHNLDKAINGAYMQLWMYLTVGAVIASLGIPPLFLTYPPRLVHSWLLGITLRHAAFLSLWTASLWGGIYLLTRADMVLDPWMLLLLFAAQVAGLLAESYLIINRRFLLLIAQSLIYAVLFGAAHYLLLRQRIGLAGLLWALTGLSLGRAISLALAGSRVFSVAAGGLKRRGLPRSVRRQWTQLGIYDVSQIAFRYIDKMLISWMVGPALFSVYFYGTIDIPFIPVLLGAAGGALLMQLATGEGSTDERIALVRYSGTILARIVFPVFFFFFFFRYEVIGVIFSARYADAVPLFAISVLALPLRAYNYTAMLQHLNQVRLINMGAALDLGIALALSYPMFVWKGLPGVAFSFMICTYVQAGFYLYHTARLLHRPLLRLIPWQQWGLMLALFGAAAKGMHDLLSRTFSPLHTLLAGFAGTVLMIAIALAPVILNRRSA